MTDCQEPRRHSFWDMPSPALLRHRHSAIGHFYVITSVTADRHCLFRDPARAALLEDSFRHSDRKGLTRSCAWVVMPDHFHWVMQLREGSLGRCVQALKSQSAIAINATLGGHAPVWQRGYYDHWIRDERDVRRQALYVVGNPVRAGLAQRLGEYPHAWCRWPLS
ncbi:transposase [Stenotrophomonas sp.]|uniref:REP-associated tyrosine transposase n=1 Tax=Stenotrophomonas sp. TaxID=69392 RepID=UPI0031D073C8